ncbi:MAG TPA: bifunctional UDP-sugar hydrolase/5'-nucleotidase [Pyrinomonadaceae bacterium]
MALISSTRRRAAGLVLALLVACSPALAQQPQQTPATARACDVRVTLLMVNDVYQFVPVDRGAAGGLARVSTLRKRILRESPNTLFLMAGDTISPSVESITYKGAQMIDAWNEVGLDYAVFGNHEFDFGPDVLRQRVAESKFTWLGASVFDAKTGKTFADTPPFVVRDIGGVRVGLFGIVLPETKTTSSPGPDVTFRDSCATAREVIPQLRARGANTIVALTHLSIREDKALARCAPEIDIIIGGHEHTLHESLVGRTPIFKMTSDGREMGQIDLNVNSATGKVESIDWKIIPVNSAVEDDPAFASINAKYGAKLKELAEPVGATAVELDARSATNRTRETNIADYIADAFRKATGADAALVNGGSIRADTVITPGPLTLRDVLTILPFGNELVKLEVKGSTLRAAIEHGLSRSREDSEPGRFPQVSGIRYTFDATLPAGSRVKSITVGGLPLDERKTYTLALAAYLAGGGDQYAMFKGSPNLLKEKLKDSDGLRRVLAEAGTIAPQTDGRIVRLDSPATETPCTVAR